MIKKWKVVFPSPNGPDERRAYIYLPASYKKNPDRRYPVLYMFDGHNVFFDSDATYGKCWGMKEYLDADETQLIVVAVECNHSPDNGRHKDYSPFTFRDPRVGHITGKGNLTMEWMVQTLKREIDENFRTLPDREHTFIAGSSMGGLMSLYALMEYNHVFSRAAALSPSIWTSPKKLDQMIRNASIAPDTVLYMDYGSREMKHHADMEARYIKTMNLLMQRKVHLTSRIVPNGDHCEASWERQIPFFINTLLFQLDN